MSWTDLFKSKKSQPQEADPRLRWFGKLPTYGDYYTSKDSEEWTVEFDNWILAGYECFHRRSTDSAARAVKETGGVDVSRRMPSSQCVIRLPKSGMTAFAAIQDYGGDMRGRPFPICFYVGVPTESWPGPTADRVCGAAGVMRRLVALRTDLAHFFNVPGRFETVFAGRQIDLGAMSEAPDDTWLRRASAIPLAVWFANTRPGLLGQSWEAWSRRVARCGANIATLESETFEATMAFPLSGKAPLDIQVAGWVRWIELRMDVSRRALSLLVTGEPESGSATLVVIAREAVTEEDFLLLTPLARTLTYVDDLTAPSAEEDGSDPEAIGGVEGTASPNAHVPGMPKSLADFVAAPTTVS